MSRQTYHFPTILNAGVVNYDVEGFCERNRDIFSNDLMELMQSSARDFVCGLFPEAIDRSSKKRPITAGAKIKSQVSGQSYKHFTSINYDPRVVIRAIF